MEKEIWFLHYDIIVVGGGHAGLDIGDEDDDVGVVDGDLSLLPHEGKDLVVGIGFDTAGIHQAELAAVPIGLPVNAVTGDTGVSSTMERRRPMILLNSMDLPTLGRPHTVIIAVLVIIRFSLYVQQTHDLFSRARIRRVSSSLRSWS